MLFRAIGMEPKFSRLPVGIFDISINALQWLADVFNSEQLENAAELGRIGKYYAVEDMVTTVPEEMYGTISLQEHFDRIAAEGQEYDPYTTMYVCDDSSSLFPIKVISRCLFLVLGVEYSDC
jgi:divinyl chlorophyllide a 8-vinyl-reductase